MSKVSSIPEGKHAVLGIDPGETTGIGAFYVELGSTLRNTLEGAFNKKTVEVRGDFITQGLLLAEIVTKFRFRANVEEGLSESHIHIVCEDFVLRRRVEGGATGNLSSCWIAGAMCGALGEVARGIVWQQPSTGKHMDNVRLKNYGLYVVGSEHMRDANRHAAQFVDRLVA